MLVKRTITYLEMTAPDQLVPGRTPPAPVEMDTAGPMSAPLLASTHARIGTLHHWRSVPEEQWEKDLARPGSEAWVARVRGNVAGMVVLKAEDGGDVEIVVMGVVPEFVGKGFGGHLLTLATRFAREMEHPDGRTTRRVWLHTSSLDHPHALRNYQRRGYRVFATEIRDKEISDE